MDLFNYSRRPTSVVYVGNTPLGGENPIRIQSMTNTSTMDTDACIAQAKRIIDAGGEYVRLTTQGVREAENLKQINIGLRSQGYDTPLVADVHFTPKVADVAALYAEKVRVNPGNYRDISHFASLIQICKEHHTAIRIGVNHGSLSERIMSQYGDTPEGMVESCMEFLRICQKEDFRNVVISIKASNTVVMVRTVRLLVAQMSQEGMAFPLHLGVTEAGEGEDGRIKSAVGIGALLLDGIGDTVRVSLSEAPEAEIPIAKKLVEFATTCRPCKLEVPTDIIPQTFNYFAPERRTDTLPDVLEEMPIKDTIVLNVASMDNELLSFISLHPSLKLVCYPSTRNRLGEIRAIAFTLMNAGIPNPLFVCLEYDETKLEDFQLKAACEAGVLFVDGIADGLLLLNQNDSIAKEEIRNTAYTILQAARARFTKTEYISCPGCGRTMYDLQSTVARIKAATSHLTGVKIGIMGCIVNGIGEMADADYGYVGAGRGKISLYKGKQCIEKNIPEENAVEKLLELISHDTTPVQMD